MLKHEDNAVGRINGNNLQPLSGVSVTVTDKVTGLPASLYADDGTTPLVQPLITNDNGYYGFKAPDGTYVLTFSGQRIETFTRELVLDDPQDNPYATKAELAAGTGSALVTFAPVGSNSVARPTQDKLREIVSTADYATLADAVAAVAVGGTVFIEGAVSITTPYVQTKRASLTCRGYDDYLLVNVGTSNDAITLQGAAAGLNGLDLKLNIYGAASSCRNALVLSRVDRSNMHLNIRTGAAQYGVVLDGGLMNDIEFDSTVNYAPPGIGSPGMAVDHMLIQKNTTYNVASNANDIKVRLEGARHGIVMTAQSNEGMNKISGTIEGLSGQPFVVTNNYGVHITNMWMEANAVASSFASCKNLRIGPAVNYINASDAAGTANEPTFTGCNGVVIDGYNYGGGNFDSACYGIEIRNVSHSYAGKFTGEGLGNGAETRGPDIITDPARPNMLLGGFGESTQENLFHNPFIDIWTLGASANPDGLPPVNATSVQVTTPLYPRHGSRFSNKVTQTTAGSGNGAHIVPRDPYKTYTEDRWIGLAIALYVASGQPDVRVFSIGGTILGTVTAKDQWTVLRASCKVAASTALEFWATCYNTGTSSYVTGEYYIGAVNIVNGMRPPKYFGDHGKRSEYIVTSVANTPAFQGQRAYVSGTGKWYMAAGTTSSADWILLN